MGGKWGEMRGKWGGNGEEMGVIAQRPLHLSVSHSPGFGIKTGFAIVALFTATRRRNKCENANSLGRPMCTAPGQWVSESWGAGGGGSCYGCQAISYPSALVPLNVISRASSSRSTPFGRPDTCGGTL